MLLYSIIIHYLWCITRLYRMRIGALYNKIHLSPSLFVLGTTIDSRQTSVARRLTQREFCQQLVASLYQNILVRPAATQHHADNTLERLHGHHYPERGQKRRGCRVGSSRSLREERHFTNTVCGTCSDHPPHYIDSCFRAYHIQALI